MEAPPAYGDTIISGRQYVIVRDVSSSTVMHKDCPGGKNRSEYMIELLFECAQEATSVDPDGKIDYATFSSPDKWTYTPDVAIDQFSDVLSKTTVGGSTYGTTLFQNIFKRHVERRNEATQNGRQVEPTTVIAFVDGDFHDREQLGAEIAKMTKSLTNKYEFRIMFVQVGQDSGATAFLNFLDDDLEDKLGAKFDIVDTKRIGWLLENGPKKLMREAVLEEHA